MRAHACPCGDLLVIQEALSDALGCDRLQLVLKSRRLALEKVGHPLLDLERLNSRRTWQTDSLTWTAWTRPQLDNDCADCYNGGPNDKIRIQLLAPGGQGAVCLTDPTTWSLAPPPYPTSLVGRLPADLPPWIGLYSQPQMTFIGRCGSPMMVAYFTMSKSLFGSSLFFVTGPMWHIQLRT